MQLAVAVAGLMQPSERVVGIFADAAFRQGFLEQSAQRVAFKAGQLPSLAAALGVGIQLPLRAVMIALQTPVEASFFNIVVMPERGNDQMSCSLMA